MKLVFVSDTHELHEEIVVPPCDVLVHCGDFTNFAPDFAAFRAVVLNYDAPDERWPPALKSSLERYVDGGGGLVSVHAADNAFPAWRAYNEMLGVGGCGLHQASSLTTCATGLPVDA